MRASIFAFFIVILEFPVRDCSSPWICQFCTAPTVSPLSDVITADPKTDYTSLYNYLNLFIQSANFVTVRSHVETDRWGKHGIWYEDLYNFSGWKHFTTGRSKTQIFSRSGTFTYFELPPFPLEKRKIRKQGKKKNQAVIPFLDSSRISNLDPEIADYEDHNFNARNCGTMLSDLRIQNVKNIIIAHLNINSIRNKFDALVHIINDNVDILVIVETKLDETFPENQFRINGFKKPYRKDRTINGGGIINKCDS